jgi:hypothetical protein
VFYCNWLGKKIGLVCWSYYFFNLLFLFSNLVILQLLTVLNTLSTAIVDIIPCTSLVGGLNDKKVEFGSRGRQNLQNIIIDLRSGSVGYSIKHTFFLFFFLALHVLGVDEFAVHVVRQCIYWVFQF